jgi:hypothetical protein
LVGIRWGYNTSFFFDGSLVNDHASPKVGWVFILQLWVGALEQAPTCSREGNLLGFFKVIFGLFLELLLYPH